MVLAFWDNGGWQDALIVAAIVFVAYLLVMWIGSLVWTYRDIQSRSRDPFTHVISVLLVLLFNLPGILLYMVLRPKETLADVYDRQLGAEALLHEIHDQAACPTCRRKIDEGFVACPFCRTALKVPCENCGKALATAWVLCPYCSADRRAPAPNVVPMRTPAPVQPPSTSSPAATVTAPSVTIVERSPEPTRAPQRPRRASTATYTPPAPAAATVPATDAPDGAGS